MSVLWETDGALANHPAPAGLAESESWANGEKTERFGGRFGHRNTQQSPMKQPPRQDALRFLKNSPKGGGRGAFFGRSGDRSKGGIKSWRGADQGVWRATEGSGVMKSLEKSGG